MARVRRARPVAARDERPSTVVTASWLAIATSAASLLLNGFGLVREAGQIGALRDSSVRQGASVSQAQTGVVVTFIVVVVVTVVYSALLVLFAVRMRQGRPTARIVVTVLCAISLISIVGFSIGAIAGLLAAFAIIFAWLPATSDWFRTAHRPAV